MSRNAAYLLVLLSTVTLIPAGYGQQPGTADPSFGLSGVVFTDFDGKSNAAVAVGIQPDAKILVCGNSTELFET
ncbi:MAG: hypothetical protein JXA23_05620, partial [Bacteroidales bacterium]|nr:hypothetical protein [Bacteroidales bacterium]